MITRAHTVTFEGMEPREVDVECAISPGLPGFAIVGLPDKAVSEARERIRAVLNGLSLDGRLNPVIGALPAALKAAELRKALYWPAACCSRT